MKITDVKIRKKFNEGNLKAIVSITLDDEFALHDIKIISNEKKVFLSMPSRSIKENQYQDIAHPTSKRFRDYVEKTILSKYYKEVIENHM